MDSDSELKYKTMYCVKCGRKTSHTTTFPRGTIVLTCCTLGVYGLIWPFVHFLGKHWHCERCGHLRKLMTTARQPF